MFRFALDPNESAKENLWRSAKIAAVVLCKKNRFYGLRGDSRDEILEKITYNAVIYFMYHKVRQHKYRRFADDGRPLTFFDNVLSSAWSASHWTVDSYMKELTVRSNTCDVETVMPCLHDGEGLPRYLSRNELRDLSRQKKYEDEQPFVRARRVKGEYEDYRVDTEDLGLQPMSFERWLSDTGYNQDEEMMIYLLPPGERIDFKDKPQSEIDEARARKRAYDRAYYHRKTRLKRLQLPPGYRFTERGGQVYIVRDTSESGV